MTTRTPDPNDSERHGHDDSGAQYARAHVCIDDLCLLFSLGRGESVGNLPTYPYTPWPPPEKDELRQVILAYRSLTGRGVYPKMVPLLAQVWRRHGPSAVSVLGELHAAHGKTNLLRVAVRWPPASAPEDDIDRMLDTYLAEETAALLDGVLRPHLFCSRECKGVANPETTVVEGDPWCVTCNGWP